MGVVTIISRAKSDIPSSEFSSNAEYTLLDEITETSNQERDVFVKIEFEQPVPCYTNANYIASKLDTDISKYFQRLI